MKFEKILNEFNYYGPAESLKKLANKVRERKVDQKSISWATNEIRTMLRNLHNGGRKSSHDKLNDILSLIAALKLYLDDGYDEKKKETLEKEYIKVVERARSKK